MPDPCPADATIRACKKIRMCERLLASAGFYEQAGRIRDQREEVERCSVESVRSLRPQDAKAYQPKTIGQEVDSTEDSNA